MKFINKKLPNVNVSYNKNRLKFVDGVYETNDKGEIDHLKKMGFGYEEDAKVEESASIEEETCEDASIEEETEKYTCEECGWEGKTEASLKGHITKYHK